MRPIICSHKRVPCFFIGISLCIFLFPPIAFSQTVEILNDEDVVLSSTQVVNVGEHVRVKVRVQPPGTSFSNPQWLVTGLHSQDWIVKEMRAVPMTVNDYFGENIHFLWKEITTPMAPHIVHVSVLVEGTILSTQIPFQVERQSKPEKFYSDDLLMEYHNNWHAVYRFNQANTRRGDLFLAWHRSQLEYFNAWRSYFGYPPITNWNPTTPWAFGTPLPQRQHPSISPSPTPNFSNRHELITLDLGDQGLTTNREGEYDTVTQTNNRGTNSQFVSDGYILTTDSVANIAGTPLFPEFSKSGVANLPTWWQPQIPMMARPVDPWFAAGCPDAAVGPSNQTCTVAIKTSFEDYTLRELGESIESGWYADDFRINYHAFGHIAASVDMGNPVTSMRDPIFWGWHTHIDQILSDWQTTKGVEAKGPLVLYGNPVFQNDWSTIRVAFSNRAVPDFVLAENVTVNGVPATQVTDVSFTGTGYLFEFSGFPVPPDGPVEVVIQREVNNGIRTSLGDPRPTPTLIMSTFGNLLTPAVIRIQYTKS